MGSMDDILDRIEADPETSALGLCVFAGAFSLGMENAGFGVAGHLEMPDLALGVESSRSRWPVMVAPYDEPEHGGQSWTMMLDAMKDRGVKPRVIHANPPCVAYAGTGKHLGANDTRMCYLRWCTYGFSMSTAPDVWTWELVPGIFDRDRDYLEAMAFRAGIAGYRSYSFLTSSALHGGTQNRMRYHFIASRYAVDFDAAYEGLPAAEKTPRTLGDALALVESARAGDAPMNDENTYSGAFSSIMPFCPPGGHLADIPDSVMREHYRPRGVPWSGAGRPGFSHMRGRLDRPCPNILGGHTVIHPTEDRYLTPREAATVQGFPLNYPFSPGSKAYQEIGRGLCVETAIFVGRALHHAITRAEPAQPIKPGSPSMMEIHDWRTRAPKVKALKPSATEWSNFYRDRHGFVPEELVG